MFEPTFPLFSSQCWAWQTHDNYSTAYDYRDTPKKRHLSVLRKYTSKWISECACFRDVSILEVSVKRALIFLLLLLYKNNNFLWCYHSSYSFSPSSLVLPFKFPSLCYWLLGLFSPNFHPLRSQFSPHSLPDSQILFPTLFTPIPFFPVSAFYLSQFIILLY